MLKPEMPLAPVTMAETPFKDRSKRGMFLYMPWRHREKEEEVMLNMSLGLLHGGKAEW